jgi:hypothetical protein
MSLQSQETFNLGRKHGYDGAPMACPEGKDFKVYEAGYFVGQQEKKKAQKAKEGVA